jgi:hypothetical protein
VFIDLSLTNKKSSCFTIDEGLEKDALEYGPSILPVIGEPATVYALN